MFFRKTARFATSARNPRRLPSARGPRSSRIPRRFGLKIEQLEERALLAIDLSGVPSWIARGPSPSILGTSRKTSLAQGLGPIR